MKVFNSHYQLGVYKGKYNLIAVDGCEFNIYRNHNDPDTYYEPSEKNNSRLQYDSYNSTL